MNRSAKPRKSVVRIILISLLILLIVIQFIRPARNDGAWSSPADITHYVYVPDTVMSILHQSCYDCHSNKTIYPWYTNINPIGFWLRGHIDGGKWAINFSDVSGFDNNKLARRLHNVAGQVEKKEMPLPSYTLIHTYAKLDSGQIQLIKQWTDSAIKELSLK